MSAPRRFREDWKVVSTFDHAGVQMAVVQKYALYVMKSRGDGQSIASHPVDEFDTVPVNDLSE